LRELRKSTLLGRKECVWNRWLSWRVLKNSYPYLSVCCRAGARRRVLEYVYRVRGLCVRLQKRQGSGRKEVGRSESKLLSLPE
jgi:hypothetical protein